MTIAALIATCFVGIAHLGFMVLEMFMWTTPTGRKIFRQTEEDAQKSAVLAANQGIYNGVLGVGLIGAAVLGQVPTAVFLSLFVVIVGLYGAYTVSWRIALIQALPGAISMVLQGTLLQA